MKKYLFIVIMFFSISSYADVEIGEHNFLINSGWGMNYTPAYLDLHYPLSLSSGLGFAGNLEIGYLYHDIDDHIINGFDLRLGFYSAYTSFSSINVSFPINNY